MFLCKRKFARKRSYTIKKSASRVRIERKIKFRLKKNSNEIFICFFFVSADNVCHVKSNTKSLREHDHHRSSVPSNEPGNGDLVRRRPLSKSDFDLSYPEDLDYLCKKFAAAERRHVTMESFASSSSPSTPGAGQGCCPTAINSTSCASATAQSTIQSINVVQKTSSFFNSLKVSRPVFKFEKYRLIGKRRFIRKPQRKSVRFKRTSV